MQLQRHKPVLAVVTIATLIVALTMISSRNAVTEIEPSVVGGATHASAAGGQVSAQDATGGTAARPARSQPFTGPLAELPPAERQKVIAGQIAQLDQRLRSEPIDATWAREQEAVIENAIIGSPTDGFDVPLPSALDQQCHSSLCRIRMTYAAEEDALQMQNKLTLGLGGPISKARTFYLPTDNGGMELIVFAGNVGQSH